MRKGTPNAAPSGGNKYRPDEDEGEDDESYGEASFESFGGSPVPAPAAHGKHAHGQQQPAKAAAPRSANSFPRNANGYGDSRHEFQRQQDAKDDANDSGEEEEEEEEEDGDGRGVAGMDLETFMENYKIEIGVTGAGGAGSGAGGKGAPSEDPSLRPLDGVSPSKSAASERERDLARRFGEAGSPSPSPLTTPQPPLMRASSGSGLHAHGQGRGAVGAGAGGRHAQLQYLQRAASPVSRPSPSRGSQQGSTAAGEGEDAGAGADFSEAAYRDEASELLARIRGSQGPVGSAGSPTRHRGGPGQGPGPGGERGGLTEQQLGYYASLVGGDHAAGDGTKPRPKAGSSNISEAEAASNAARVDQLLAELLPDRAARMAAIQQNRSLHGGGGGPGGGAGGKGAAGSSSKAAGGGADTTLSRLKERHRQMEFATSSSSSGAYAPKAMASTAVVPPGREYGKGAPGYFGNSSGGGGGGGGAGDPQEATLASQIASLKKDLRHRDERLQRVTEHSLSLGQTLEQQKAEIAALKEQLRAALQDLEAKEVRAQDATKLRKKAQRKAKAAEEAAAEAEQWQQDNERLREVRDVRGVMVLCFVCCVVLRCVLFCCVVLCCVVLCCPSHV
jgi:hypothetical protein